MPGLFGSLGFAGPGNYNHCLRHIEQKKHKLAADQHDLFVRSPTPEQFQKVVDHCS
jgi:hypothetical protein